MVAICTLRVRGRSISLVVRRMRLFVCLLVGWRLDCALCIRGRIKSWRRLRRLSLRLVLKAMRRGLLASDMFTSRMAMLWVRRNTDIASSRAQCTNDIASSIIRSCSSPVPLTRQLMSSPHLSTCEVKILSTFTLAVNAIKTPNGRDADRQGHLRS